MFPCFPDFVHRGPTCMLYFLIKPDYSFEIFHSSVSEFKVCKAL